MYINFSDFDETWPEHSSDISAECDALMNFEIFFSYDFPNYDNNLHVSILWGAKEEPDVKVPWGMTGIRREKKNKGHLAPLVKPDKRITRLNGSTGIMGIKGNMGDEG